MLSQVLEEINNYYDRWVEKLDLVIAGTAKTITGDFDETYLIGQYIHIKGSILNDGVYKLTAVASGVLTVEDTLVDETNEMKIFGLAIPSTLLKIVTDIENDPNLLLAGVMAIKQGERSTTYFQGSDWIVRYGTRLAPFYKVEFEC